MPTAVELPTGEDLECWDGFCVDLAGELQAKYGGDLVYIEGDDLRGPDGTAWKWHAVLLLDGLVFDAWFPHLRMPLDEYIFHAFGSARYWINPGAEEDEPTHHSERLTS